MADISKDIEILNATLKGDGPYNLWRHIYPRTTENVLRVLDVVDVKGKDAFAVLSSSDILFSLIDKKAKRIDTFDINPLTLRYYYLRKWMLECGVLDGKDLSYEEVHNIINASRKYVSVDEEESVRLWNEYVDGLEKWFFNLYNAALFDYVPERFACSYDEHIDNLVDYLCRVPLSFQQVDIGTNDGTIRQDEYDLVYASNIMDLNDHIRVQTMRDRFYSMLRSDGEVICTNLVNHPYFHFFEEQKRIFEERFIYDELFRERIGHQDNVYYRYIKK